MCQKEVVKSQNYELFLKKKQNNTTTKNKIKKKTGFLCHFLDRKKKKRVQQITLKYSTNRSITLGPLALTLPLQPGKLLRKQPSKALQKDAHTPPMPSAMWAQGPFPRLLKYSTSISNGRGVYSDGNLTLPEELHSTGFVQIILIKPLQMSV